MVLINAVPGRVVFSTNLTSNLNQELSLKVAATTQGHSCRLRFVPFWAGYL